MACKYGDPSCPCQDSDHCHYEPHRATNTPANNVPPEFVLRAVAAEREACAELAWKHRYAIGAYIAKAIRARSK